MNRPSQLLEYTVSGAHFLAHPISRVLLTGTYKGGGEMSLDFSLMELKEGQRVKACRKCGAMVWSETIHTNWHNMGDV